MSNDIKVGVCSSGVPGGGRVLVLRGGGAVAPAGRAAGAGARARQA